VRGDFLPPESLQDSTEEKRIHGDKDFCVTAHRVSPLNDKITAKVPNISGIHNIIENIKFPSVIRMLKA